MNIQRIMRAVGKRKRQQHGGRNAVKVDSAEAGSIILIIRRRVVFQKPPAALQKHLVKIRRCDCNIRIAVRRARRYTVVGEQIGQIDKRGQGNHVFIKIRIGFAAKTAVRRVLIFYVGFDTPLGIAFKRRARFERRRLIEACRLHITEFRMSCGGKFQQRRKIGFVK